MLNVKSLSIASAGAVCLTLAISQSAQSVQLFDFAYSGPDVIASGQLTTTDLNPGNNSYAITRITGQRNGTAIDSLVPNSSGIPFTLIQNRLRFSSSGIVDLNVAYRVVGSSLNQFFYVYQVAPPGTVHLEDVGRPPVVISLSVTPAATSIPTPVLLPSLLSFSIATLRRKVLGST